jgi:acyl-CoA synthetase (AMP-forming)/AMP-acid ligase II
MMAERNLDTTRRWNPRQITLGGEPLRSRVGQAAQERFAASRVTVVYASAELGVIAKGYSWDGSFGFPALARRWTDWRLGASGAELEVQDADGWHSTGDQVEVKADRFRVLGRIGAVANVGGVKVSLAYVESVAETVVGIQTVRAWAVPSPVTGQIVGLRFSVLPGFDPTDVTEALGRYLRRQLPREAQPRLIELIAAGIGPNAKQCS